MNYSEQFFNYICLARRDEGIFNVTEGRGSFPHSRLFDGSSDHSEGIFSQDIQSLAGLPTLITHESGPNEPDKAPAILCRIRGVRRIGGSIVFDFIHIWNRVASESIWETNALRLEPWQRSRTHWAVMDGDLIRVMSPFQRSNSGLPCPRLFAVEPWPPPECHQVAVMMPFAAEFNSVFQAISRACEKHSVPARRVDQIHRAGTVKNDIFKLIAESRLVISDLTGQNANVLYETGLAHALDRNVIFLVQDPRDVPFDLRPERYIKYHSNAEGLQELENGLVRSLGESLST